MHGGSLTGPSFASLVRRFEQDSEFEMPGRNGWLLSRMRLASGSGERMADKGGMA
jgi:hypothetical protein